MGTYSSSFLHYAMSKKNNLLYRQFINGTLRSYLVMEWNKLLMQNMDGGYLQAYSY